MYIYIYGEAQVDFFVKRCSFGVCFRSSRRTKNTRLEATLEPANVHM